VPSPKEGIAVHLEVEQKFPVPELAPVESALARLGAQPGPSQEERDLYFGHPARDFSQTDEALRIRRKGPGVFITYKGPKIDQTTKTRREIELPLGPSERPAEDTAAAWAELLLALGFRRVAEVCKLRRKARLARHGFQVEICLDQVSELGSFVELEVVAQDDQLDRARACLAKLAGELGLEKSERRSYLELLLERGHEP